MAEILLRGEFTLNGFRNRDVRLMLHLVSRSAANQRPGSAQVSRLLCLFRERGLIRKVKGTHRYHLIAHGRRALPAFIAARNASTEQLNKLAA